MAYDLHQPQPISGVGIDTRLDAEGRSSQYKCRAENAIMTETCANHEDGSQTTVREKWALCLRVFRTDVFFAGEYTTSVLMKEIQVELRLIRGQIV
jgi:hypothetical protein